MDVRFINPVLESTVQTLEKMAALVPEVGKPALKQGRRARGCVTGMMSMRGRNVEGSIALSFSLPVIRQLVKQMLRMEISSIDETASDLAGELSNIVAGQSKTKLAESGLDIDMSLPVVLAGVDHDIDHRIEAPVVVLPFKTQTGDFFVELCFSNVASG